MDDFWKENFGYGIDQLTQSEAGRLRAAPTIDAIRDRIAAARHEGIKRLDTARTQAPARTDQKSSPAIKTPDPDRGYVGKIVDVADTHVVQQVEGGQLVQHDRAKLFGKTAILILDQTVNISYTAGLGKVSSPQQRTKGRGR